MSYYNKIAKYRTMIKHNEEDYHAQHKAPSSDGYSSPLYDVTLNDTYPKDIYSSKAALYYGDGVPDDKISIGIIQSVKDKPNEVVAIYRAIPSVLSNKDKIALYLKHMAYIENKGKLPRGIDNWSNATEYYEYISDEIKKLEKEYPKQDGKTSKINKGDWVTINKKYAMQHGKNSLDGQYKILTLKVKAKDVWTDGSSIHEQGYDPS